MQTNILLGKPFCKVALQRVVKAARLEPDIASWPQGLQTEIGEKGITLSGGQKARVAMARALYADADVYLLDDPLSAVDPKVARLLFKHAIMDQLVAKGKLVVLVTHQLQFVPFATQVQPTYSSLSLIVGCLLINLI